MKFSHHSYDDKKSHKSMLEGALSHKFYVLDGICLIGTQGKQPATKTTKQYSLFTGTHAEFGMRHFLVFVSHVFAPDCW